MNTFNIEMLHHVCQNITTIAAADIMKGNKQRKVPIKQVNTLLAAHLDIAVNARVMLTTNLDVSDGLSNGVIGTVTQISMRKSLFSQPESICVQFDNKAVGRSTRLQNQHSIGSDVVLIKPHAELFQFEGSPITRYQYPLKLAWACTVHKTQGMTLKSAAVSLKYTFLAGMAYVAMSRVSSLAGLYLKDFEDKYVYCDTEVTQSMSRMPSLHISSMPLVKCIMQPVKLTIVAQNIHSIKKHLEDVTKHPELMRADLLVFSESWLSRRINNAAVALPDFREPLRSDRQSESGRGGVAVYVKDHLPVPKQHPTEQAEGLETVLVEIQNTFVLAVYRSPSIATSLLSTNLVKIIRDIPLHMPTIVCGDFNIDVFAHTNDVEVPALHDFQQIIKDPTYCAGSHRSLLDHIYVRNCTIHNSGVLCTYFSDHDPTFVQIK